MTKKFKKVKEEQMKAVFDSVLRLKSSPLYNYRQENKYLPVIGEGSLDAKIMLIGEAPGKNEALTGQPFCGSSGRVLDKLLGSVEIKREEVYITSILKDRPPGNRDPLAAEIEIYAPFLDQQIEIIEPKVIVTLGRFSMKYMFERYGLADKLDTIGKLHGQFFETKITYGVVSIVPLYHPAVAVYNGTMFNDLKHDFQIIKKFIFPTI